MSFDRARRLTGQMSTSGNIEGRGAAEQPRPVETARASDESELDRLFDRHRPALELCCYLMLGDRTKARAAMSETALTAREARVGVAPAIPGRIWLYRIAIHVCDEVAACER